MIMNKSTTILIIILASTVSVHAQIHVDNDGHVGLGTTLTSGSILNVGGIGNSSYTSTFNATNEKRGIYINNKATTFTPTGLFIMNECGSNKTVSGLRVAWNGNPYFTTNQSSYGIHSVGGGSTQTNIGVFGSPAYSGTNNIGILGSSSGSESITYEGTYAGYFIGDVRTIGATYGTLLSQSPITETSSITPLSDNLRDNNVTQKLMLMEPILVINSTDIVQEKRSAEQERLAEELNEYIPEDVTPVVTQMAATRYAIDYNTIQESFPELIYKDEHEHISINYIEMIPLLLQSIKELNLKIEELEKQLKAK